MSIIPDLSDVPELSPVAEGEYELRVTKAKMNESKRTGRKGIMLVCEIVGEDNADNLIETMWLPMPSDDPDKAQTMSRMLKERLIALGLPTDGSNELEDFQDLEFSAFLEYEEDDTYGNRNVIKRIT